MFSGEIVERFWKYVEKGNGCWNHTGKNMSGPASREYPRVHLRAEGKRRIGIAAHRFSWILHCGPIPDGLLVLHTCDNTRCVNPEHLFLGTYLDNNQDTLFKGHWDGSRGQHHATKTHCPQGHEYSESNTRIQVRGHLQQRICITCMKAASRRHYERKKANQDRYSSDQPAA